MINVNKYEIKEIDRLENGCRYNISLELPMKDGWCKCQIFL